MSVRPGEYGQHCVSMQVPKSQNYLGFASTLCWEMVHNTFAANGRQSKHMALSNECAGDGHNSRTSTS
jgi:hypothetical protein